MGQTHFVRVSVVNPDSDRPMIRAVCLHCRRALTTAVKPRNQFNQFSDYQRYMKEEDRKIREVFGPNPDVVTAN